MDSKIIFIDFEELSIEKREGRVVEEEVCVLVLGCVSQGRYNTLGPRLCPCPHINNTPCPQCFSFTLVPGWASEGHREREGFPLKNGLTADACIVWVRKPRNIWYWGWWREHHWSHLVFHIRVNRYKAVMKKIGFYFCLYARERESRVILKYFKMIGVSWPKESSCWSSWPYNVQKERPQSSKQAISLFLEV